MASTRQIAPMIVNGVTYEPDEDVKLKAVLLGNAWEKLLDSIHDQQRTRLGLSSDSERGLLLAFDKAYTAFEKAYIGFLIGVESSCKSILIHACSIGALLEVREDTQLHEDFVGLLQELNSVANSVGKGRQDLDYGIYEGAKQSLEGGRLPAMCGRVLDAHDRAVQYFKKFRRPGWLDVVHPDLRLNSDLVDVLAEWEEAWEVAMPYVCSIQLQKSLGAFVDTVLTVCDRCPEFKDACLCSDVEAILIIPQLFVAFCANHAAEAPEILKVASDLSPEEADLPGATDNLSDLLCDLARGEILSKYCDCGIRLQRTNPSAWNNFSKLLSAELMEKLG